MRFCQASWSELYRHIGPDCDLPAGDVGRHARIAADVFICYALIRTA